MANRGLSAVPNDASAAPKFEEREVVIRGQTFKIRELSSAEYDGEYRKAEKQDGDIDTVLLLRLMALKSISPTMTAEELGALPMRVSRALMREVNELHFEDEPTSETPAKND